MEIIQTSRERRGKRRHFYREEKAGMPLSVENSIAAPPPFIPADDIPVSEENFRTRERNSLSLSLSLARARGMLRDLGDVSETVAHVSQ